MSVGIDVAPMKALLTIPLDRTASDLWSRVDGAYKKAFFAVLVVSILAFGFEMTNLTIDHDDLWEIFIEDDILGHYIGRFAFGWLHLYTQGAHIMPFMQVVEGITVMALYGLLVARLWGLRRTVDIAIVASVLCVFPYMAQVNSYNAVIVPYAIAHLLAASAVALSTRIDWRRLAAAAALYAGAFLIYQSVVANAATIFVVWLASSIVFGTRGERLPVREIGKAASAAVIAVGAGSVLYLAIVWYLGVPSDSYQGASEAFSLEEKGRFLGALPQVLTGTRAFFFWPEPYFPDYLKKLQLVLILGAAIVCAWVPDKWSKKVSGLVLLGASLITPRLLQFLHPLGTFHNLTLTAYAVSVAGAVMMLARGGSVFTRNVSTALVSLLIGGYLIQANWISTVNYLNTLAQYATMTQILARVRAIPSDRWDGKRIVFLGKLSMPSTYPFKHATGVATAYIDEQLGGYLVQLLRADLVSVPAGTIPAAAKYAQTHRSWPHEESVAPVDGVAVVVLSSDSRAASAQSEGDALPPTAPK